MLISTMDDDGSRQVTVASLRERGLLSEKNGLMCSPVCEWLEDLIGGFGVFGKESLAVDGI